MIESSNLEGRLCGELVAAIARCVTTSDRGTNPGRKGVTFYHYSYSAFEAATRALQNFALLVPVPHAERPDETWYCPQALVMDADAMPDHLGRLVGSDDPRLPQLLEAFILVACDHGGLPHTRAPFSCPDAHLDAVRMLERTGYVEAVGDQYRWTAKIGPAMRAAVFWNEDDMDRMELEEAETERQAEAALQTMPDAIRDAFMNAPDDVISWYAVVCACWKDGRWQDPQPGPVVLSGGLDLARRLAEKFKTRYGIDAD
jgi:hypothetical protein